MEYRSTLYADVDLPLRAWFGRPILVAFRRALLLTTMPVAVSWVRLAGR